MHVLVMKPYCYSHITFSFSITSTTLSQIFIVWFINSISLKLLQLCTSPLFLKIGTSKLFLYSSEIFSLPKILLNCFINKSPLVLHQDQLPFYSLSSSKLLSLCNLFNFLFHFYHLLHLSFPLIFFFHQLLKMRGPLF